MSQQFSQSGGQNLVATIVKETTTTTFVPSGDASTFTAVGGASATSSEPSVVTVAASQVGQAARADAADLKEKIGAAASQVGSAASQVGSAVAADTAHLVHETGDALSKVASQAKQSVVETGVAVKQTAVDTAVAASAKLDQAAAQGEVILTSAMTKASEFGTAVAAKACEVVATVAGATTGALHGAEAKLEGLQQTASGKAAELHQHQEQLQQQAQTITAQSHVIGSMSPTKSELHGMYPTIPTTGVVLEQKTTVTTTTVPVSDIGQAANLLG